MLFAGIDEIIDGTATCGDCIYADECAKNPHLTDFSRDNFAYCEGFKDKNEAEGE